MAGPLSSDELAALLKEHGAALSFYASGWTTAPDDCVQEALIKLAGQVPPPGTPVSWLYRVVRLRAHNHYRGESRRARYEQASGQRIDNRGAEISFSEAVDLLDQLSDDARELVVLKIWGNRTLAEIAEITGRSTSSLHRDYQAALERLRNLLSHGNEVTHASRIAT